jgi:hypothetical protein
MVRRGWFGVGAVGAIAALTMLAVPGSSWAGGPRSWTQLGVTDNGADTFGVLRTADQNLHVVWLTKRASNSTQSYDWATISVAGRLAGTGTALSGWGSLSPDPRLVADGSGIRLIFNGNTGSTGCYADGEIFTETSTGGSTWNLVSGSLDHGTVGAGGLAATDEADMTTPVAVFGNGHEFHVGVDPSCPAASADGVIPPTIGSAQGNPAVVTDTKTGAVYVAWYQSFIRQGFWVEQILPTQGMPIEAPDSGPNTTPFFNNQPVEPVAIAARHGGGVYMAYCVADKTGPCSHIDMWQVGSSKVTVVPGSQRIATARVALAADPPGNMSVAWFNSTNNHNVIDAVRTNSAVTGWGSLVSTPAPAHTFIFNDLQADGSSIRLDLLAVDTLGTAGDPIGLYQTQILPGLTLTAKPTSFSHRKSEKVTFRVTDAGQPVSGAMVKCLGKSGSTSSGGTVKLKFGKGEPKGRHLCLAMHVNYAEGRVVIKVK